MQKLRLFILLVLSVVFISACSSNTTTDTKPVAVKKAKANPPQTTSAPDYSNLATRNTATTLEGFYEAYQKDYDATLAVTYMMPQESHVHKWRADLMALSPYLSTWLPKLKGKTLNVVLQEHDDGGGLDEKQQPSVAASQKHGYEVLTKLNPKLLTIEGSYMDRFSKKSFNDELNQTMREMLGPELTKESEVGIDESSVTMLGKRNAAIKYALEHPECHTIGGEWRGLHMLDVMMMDANAPPEARAAFTADSKLRSWNTAARVSEFMEKDKLNEATINIGFMHKSDFETIAKLYGINVVFY